MNIQRVFELGVLQKCGKTVNASKIGIISSVNLGFLCQHVKLPSVEMFSHKGQMNKYPRNIRTQKLSSVNRTFCCSFAKTENRLSDWSCSWTVRNVRVAFGQDACRVSADERANTRVVNNSRLAVHLSSIRVIDLRAGCWHLFALMFSELITSIRTISNNVSFVRRSSLICYKPMIGDSEIF